MDVFIYLFDICNHFDIDLEKAFNEIVVIDEETQKFVEQALNVKFKDGVTKRDGILMRKEIVPLIKEVLKTGKLS